MKWQWLGRLPYPDAVAHMEALRSRILDGDDAAATLLLCEHPPVITLGRRARAAHVVASEALLAARGVTVAQSSRGGDVTYHGPGQLVAYPVMRLATGVVDHVCRLAKATIAVAARYGIESRFDRARPGVWARVGAGEAKLAAVGVHVHRRVAIHGLALNVTTALDAFDLIVPCGLRDIQVTSIAALSGQSPALPDLARAFAEEFARLDGRTVCAVDEQSLQLQPSSVE